MSLEAFLVSMQAAGAISDIIGTRQQQGLGRAGSEVEQAQINTRMEEERVASALRSLDAMKQLRMTMASQRAIFAARGQKAGAGSAFSISQASVREFQSDERVRKMNLITRQGTLRAAGVLSGMHQLSSETQLGQELSQRMWQRTPFSQFGEIWKRGHDSGEKKQKAVEGV